MKLPELILELVKAGFTIGNTISADFNRTTLTRDSDNALASILSSDSESVWSLALFPDCNLDLPIVIKNKPSQLTIKLKIFSPPSPPEYTKHVLPTHTSSTNPRIAPVPAVQLAE
jgi:hypothetical protein